MWNWPRGKPEPEAEWPEIGCRGNQTGAKGWLPQSGRWRVTSGEGRVRSWELELKSGDKPGVGNRGSVFKSNGAWLLYDLEKSSVFAGRWQDGAKVGGHG